MYFFILSLQKNCRMVVPKSHQRRGCKKFVVRPSGGSLYLGFRLITNFRLKAELRTSCFYTVSKLVDRSYSAYKGPLIARPRIPPTKLMDRSYSAYKRNIA